MSLSSPLLIGAGVIAAASIPLILKVVPPNHFYGFRTPSTLANREVWYRANVFAGWAFLIAAIASIVLIVGGVGGAFPGVASEAASLALPLAIAAVACFVYLRKIKGSAAGGGK